MPIKSSELSNLPITLVGHTAHKFRRLHSLLETPTQSKALQIRTVFNGKEAEPCDLRVDNDLQMRDVGMYRNGLNLLGAVKSVICINDDVEYIAPQAL